MKIFYNYKKISKYTKNSTLLVGNFDGVHRGHQKIIESAKKIRSCKNNIHDLLLSNSAKSLRYRCFKIPF